MADVAEIKQTQTPGIPGDVNVLNIKEPGVDTSKFEKASAKAYKDSITNWDFAVKNEWKKQCDEAVQEFGNNPAQLQQALEKIRTEMLPSDTPPAIRNQFMKDTYYDSASILNKTITEQKKRQRKQTKINATAYAEGLSDDLATSYFNVLTYNAVEPAEKRPMDVETYVKQRSDLAKLADLTDDDGSFYFTETQRKKMKNPENAMLEGFKQFFDGMLLNDDDDLKNSTDYYTKFMLAPERYMADNGMSRTVYEKAKAYAQKELKRAGADIKKARFNQSVKEYTSLQLQDLPGTVESLRESGLLPKEMINQMEKVNVKFNEIDPSKTESPVAMLDLLRMINSAEKNPAPTNDAEQQKILEQGTATLDSIAEYAQTYGLNPKNVQRMRETVVNWETNTAFAPIMQNFSDIIDNFESKMTTVRNISTGKGGLKTAWQGLTLLDKMSYDESVKLIRLNNLLSTATDTINQQIRQGDWAGVKQTQREVQKNAAQIKYDWVDWEEASKNPEYRVNRNGRVVRPKDFTFDGDVIFEIVE